MTNNQKHSFFALIRRKFFEWSTDGEIFGMIFRHLGGEKRYDYPFRTREEMDAETRRLDASALLEEVESRISRMPKAQGQAFRYMMHRDISERLRMYGEFARKNESHKACYARYVVTHA